MRRWSFRCDNEVIGGISLDELIASAVCEPVTGRLWLFHKKVFNLIRDQSTGRMVADVDQAVPVCKLCLCALQRSRPIMPTLALANDFWDGMLPPVLRDLGEIAWHVLALVRPLIKRWRCLPSGVSRGRVDPKECSQGFVGNVAAYPQRDAGAVLLSLPPRPETLKGTISIAFVGSAADMQRPFEKPLRVSLQRFRAAYEFLREKTRCIIESSGMRRLRRSTNAQTVIVLVCWVCHRLSTVVCGGTLVAIRQKKPSRRDPLMLLWMGMRLPLLVKFRILFCRRTIRLAVNITRVLMKIMLPVTLIE